MKRLVLIAALAGMIDPITAATWQTAWSFGDLHSKPYMGFIRKEGEGLRYSVTLNIGIEQYEHGKRGAHRDQQWFLQCAYPAFGTREETSCTLQRTVLDRVFENLGTVCNETEHSLSDGTLELVNSDWADGRLDFNIVHGDGSKTSVFLNMSYTKDSIYLDELKAGINSRGVFGSAASLEFRIPEYTYVQQVPIVMTGMRNTWDKEWDQMSAILSAADRPELEKLVGARLEIVGRVLKRQMESEDAKALQKLNSDDPANKKTVATLGKRITNASGAYFLELVAANLKQSEMSAVAQQKVLEFLRLH